MNKFVQESMIATGSSSNGKEFSPHRTREVFEVVANAADWKGPIAAFVPIAKWRELTLTYWEVREAVEFFTATAARFVPVEEAGECLGFVVLADGYRAGPAGDR